MSRTNPYKKKRRQANKLLLIFGEGMNEEMFLKHLRKLYSCDTDVAITIKKGKGGDAENIVLDASKVPGGFNRRIVVLDDDKPKKEMQKARIIAKEKEIELIENKPCLDHLLLLILDSKNVRADSKKCKKAFEDDYIKKEQRRESYGYDKCFTKEVLEEKRKTVVTLDNIIQIMEGK